MFLHKTTRAVGAQIQARLCFFSLDPHLKVVEVAQLVACPMLLVGGNDSRGTGIPYPSFRAQM
jgi:hypothetical protein